MEEILINDPKQLEKKINTIKKDGLSHLHVISDFDKTITKAFVRGKKIHSTYALIRENKFLVPGYSEKAFALFDKFHPYETSRTLSEKEKNIKMNEWWETHYDLMIESGMSKEVIKKVLDLDSIEVREKFKEIVNLLNKKKIPLLIFSASIGNVIEGYMKRNGFMKENIHVIANFFKFKDDGEVIKETKKFIHVFNKNEFSIKSTKHYDKIKSRKNVILMGDTLGDLKMSHGIKNNTMLSIGFLNDKIEENKKDFLENYDIVITNDGSMQYVYDLLKKIIN